jgi:hypothetical protein
MKPESRHGPRLRCQGITLFAVEADMPGFHRGRKLDKVGQPEADTAELFFDDLRVPAGNVIGDIDRGFAHMMQMLPQERIGAAVSNLGHFRPILDETLAYARERKAFGQPIGTFQYNKFRLAELVTAVEVAQSYVDSCVAAHALGDLTAVDAAKAKWWSAQVQNEVLDACVQLHSGYGYMREYRVARAWMDARVTRIWAGSNEILKEIIGRDLGLWRNLNRSGRRNGGRVTCGRCAVRGREQTRMNLGGQLVDEPGQVRIDMQFLLARHEVVVGLGLLKDGLPVLTDHHERRQEYRLQRDDECQRGPWALFKDEHPHSERHRMEVHEPHRAGEGRNRVRNTQLDIGRPLLSLTQNGRVPRLVGRSVGHG